jgi:hypothetical protein
MSDVPGDPTTRPDDAPRAPLASVVIPAHNEAGVIGRLLANLSPAVAAGHLDVVVACNGCTDDTADVARRHGVRVVEVAQASKVDALDAGDAAAVAFPRIYADADLVLPLDTVHRLVAAVAAPGVLCASPPLAVDAAGRPWLVRAFYTVWESIPYMRDRHIGGVIAMAEAGRARFGAWPRVIADDRFARLLFRRDERQVVGTEPVLVEAPWTVAAMVRRRMRVYAGNLEVAEHPDLADLPGRHERSAPWWRVVVEQPFLAPAAVAYAGVNVVARLAARREIRRRRPIGWGHDTTTRAAAEPAGGAATAAGSGAR